MFARYPTTRLDQAELTLEAYIADTAHLPLAELQACISFACETSPTFVPVSSEGVGRGAVRAVIACFSPGPAA